jgi:P pilus assembly chaperone PapD
MQRHIRWSPAGLAALVLLTQTVTVARAVTVAPHAVFMDHRTRSGVFYVQNPGLEPIEVQVDLEFGYPTSDDQGAVRVTLFEHPDASQPSAAQWIRALPRRLVVPPGQRQAVRLLAQPPAGLPDGEYWSRIIVTSKDQTPVRETSQSDVRVGLELVTRTIISLNYRKGETATGVKVKNFSLEPGDDDVTVQVDLERTGNAAFLGRMELRVVDAQGAVLDTWDRSIAVYYDLRRRIVLAQDALPPGTYRVLMRLSTDRLDIDAADLRPIQPLEATAFVSIGFGR